MVDPDSWRGFVSNGEAQPTVDESRETHDSPCQDAMYNVPGNHGDVADPL